MKAVIVDDELRGASSLNKLLELCCPEVTVTGLCHNAFDVPEFLAIHQPQLVFLDIAMPGKNIFEVLEELPSIPFEIIFVTAHSNYMHYAFQFSAVDYLVKPVDEQKLTEAVKRATRRLNNKQDSHQLQTLLHNIRQQDRLQAMKLCIPSVKGFQVVEVPSIVYCEAESNYTNLYFENAKPICSAKAIHEYEALLTDCNFLRVHKSYLVNLAHIKEYMRGEGGSLILSNGKEIDVARRKKEALLLRLKELYKF